MRHSNLSSVVRTGAFLLVGSAGLAAAQTAAGGMAAPRQSTAPSTFPAENRPGTDTPIDRNHRPSKASKVDDKQFLKDAAQGGRTEVELGKLASQKASSDDVKQFAQKMVDDHSKANDKLKDVASQDDIEVPATLDSSHQSRIDKLSKLSGDEFDKAYIKDQLKDHETDVKDFQAEAQNGKDPKVKAFASETLPTLQQHLSMIKNLNKSGKGSE
jgi:putative membrane protein